MSPPTPRRSMSRSPATGRPATWSGRPGRRRGAPRDADGCGGERLRLAAAVTIPTGEDWASGYYAVTVTAGDERADAFLVIRPHAGSGSDPHGPVHHHVERLQRLGRALAVHGRDPGVVRASARAGVPGEARAPSSQDAAGARPRGAVVLRVGRTAGPLRVERRRGLVELGTRVPALGRGARLPVDVAISQDLERHPELLDGHRLFLCVGHDEYWSWGMRDALDAFTDAGGNAAIFSGNTCFWQVRFSEDDRAMICFKYRADEDPVVGTPDERLLSGVWSDRRIGRPEPSTIGLTFTRGGYSRYGLGVPRGSGAYTVWRPDHWAFEGTDLRYGDELGRDDAIVAYEVDGCDLTLVDGLPVPTGDDGAPPGAHGARHRPGAPLVPGRTAQPVRARARRGREHRDGPVRRGLARPGPSGEQQPRLHRRVQQAGRRHRVQRRGHGLGGRPGRPRRRARHAQRARSAVAARLRPLRSPRSAPT